MSVPLSSSMHICHKQNNTISKLHTTYKTKTYLIFWTKKSLYTLTLTFKACTYLSSLLNHIKAPGTSSWNNTARDKLYLISAKFFTASSSRDCLYGRCLLYTIVFCGLYGRTISKSKFCTTAVHILYYFFSLKF